jgi:hypothetical protein
MNRWILAYLLFLAAWVWANESLKSVDCKNFSASDLIGKQTPRVDLSSRSEIKRGPEVVNFGATRLSNPRFAVETWQVCRNNVWLLTEVENRETVVRDVQTIPNHSKEEILYTGDCEYRGRPIEDTVGVLRFDSLAKELPAVETWTIDWPAKKFRAQNAEGVACPNKQYGL